MHKTFWFICIWLLASANAMGQKKVLKAHFQPIENLDFDAYEDLDFLKEVLKDKRIVFLGEGSHYDGSTLAAKAKMIHYLSEEMGFDVLLLEKNHNVYYQIFRDFSEGKSGFEETFCGIHGSVVSGISKEYLPLCRYLSEQIKEYDFKIAGIDITIDNRPAFLNQELFDLLNELDGNLACNRELYEAYVLGVTQLTDMCLILSNKPQSEVDEKIRLSLRDGRIPVAFIDSQQVALQYLMDYLTVQMDSTPDAVLQQRIYETIPLLKNYYLANKWLKSMEGIKYDPQFDNKRAHPVPFFNLRDAAMAEQLRYYIDEVYPDRKIIVSTSTSHMTRSPEAIIGDKGHYGGGYKPMGDYVKDRTDTYHIAFISRTGYRGAVEKDGRYLLRLKKPKLGRRSIERILGSRGADFGFLDFQQPDVKRELNKGKYGMNATVHKLQARWPKMFDGVFYIDEMHPIQKGGLDIWKDCFPKIKWYGQEDCHLYNPVEAECK